MGLWRWRNVKLSLVEYLPSFGKSGWAVLVGVFASASGLVLAVTRGDGYPPWFWLTLLFVGLIIGPFLAFHRVRDKRDDYAKRVDELENTRPSFVVEPKKQDDKSWLAITNSGNSRATISVSVEQLEGIGNSVPAYPLEWRENNSNECSVQSGAKGHVDVAQLHGMHSSGMAVVQFFGHGGHAPPQANLSVNAVVRLKVSVYADSDSPPRLSASANEILRLRISRPDAGDPYWRSFEAISEHEPG